MMRTLPNRPTARQVGVFTVIALEKPVKKPRRQSQREREEAVMRQRVRANAPLYEPMSNALRLLTDGFTRHQLLSLAAKLCREKGTEFRVDRGAIRHKCCLICWFCEHFPELIGRFPPPAQSQPEPDPVWTTSSGSTPRSQQPDPFRLVTEKDFESQEWS
jgi:hypothetical protein